MRPNAKMLLYLWSRCSWKTLRQTVPKCLLWQNMFGTSLDLIWRLPHVSCFPQLVPNIKKWISSWLMTWFIYCSSVISRLSLICESLQCMAVHAKVQIGWTNQCVALKMWLQIMENQMLKIEFMPESTRKKKKLLKVESWHWFLLAQMRGSAQVLFASGALTLLWSCC